MNNFFCTAVLKGIQKECGSTIGGIKQVYALHKSSLSNVELNDFGSLKSLTYDGAPTIDFDSDRVPHYAFRDQTGSVDTEIVVDEATGSTYYDTTISLQFSKQDGAIRREIMQLASADLALLVRDNNDEWWLYGADYPVTLASGNATTGTAFGDFNGYNITLKEMSREMAPNATVFVNQCLEDNENERKSNN